MILHNSIGDRRQSTSRHYATPYSLTHTVRTSWIWIFFCFPSSSPTIPSQMRVWCTRISVPHAHIFRSLCVCVAYIFTMHINIYDRLLKVIERIEKCWPINWCFYYTGSLWPSFECARLALSYIVCWRRTHPNYGMRVCVCECVRARVCCSRMTTAHFFFLSGISLFECVSFRVSAMNGASVIIGLWYRIRFCIIAVWNCRWQICFSLEFAADPAYDLRSHLWAEKSYFTCQWLRKMGK